MLFVLLVIFIAAVMWLFSTLTKRRGPLHYHDISSAPGTTSSTKASDALRILDERFARGEIDADDYKSRRELLLDHSI